MKNVFFIMLLSSVSLGINAQEQEVLTNQNVMNLVQKGLPPSVIIAKIRSAKNNFDVSIDTLIKLKENNVPDEVKVQLSIKGASYIEHQDDLGIPVQVPFDAVDWPRKL